MPSHEIYRSNESVFEAYHELRRGDCIVGRLRLRPSDEHIVVDLLSRGVTLIPSGLAQLASRSKTLQVLLFSREFMVPETQAIHDLHDLQKAVSTGKFDTTMLTKLDRKNAGLGILRWTSIEDIYNAAVLGSLPFPFVLQPFIANCRDVRVIILGSLYLEAYERINANNFRNNLHFGGKSKPFLLDPKMEAFCRQVMARGLFDYAHIDLLLASDGRYYLNEINLKGGLRGAAISAARYHATIEQLHEIATAS